jgi:hypothetical protein
MRAAGLFKKGSRAFGGTDKNEWEVEGEANDILAMGVEGNPRGSGEMIIGDEEAIA